MPSVGLSWFAALDIVFSAIVRVMKNLYYIVAFVVLLVLGMALLALPAVVRAIPGRYASLLPEPLQELRHIHHPITLPTPSGLGNEVASPPASRPTSLPATETPSPTPEPSPTLEPSVTPPPTSTSTPSPTPTATLAPKVFLEGGRHERQGWNNCGPTTLAMALSYWGFDDGQFDIAPVVKPDPEDKHVGIHQMADYAEGLGLNATIRANGTLEGLKQLLNGGFPVIIESWYVRDARDQLGHYRLVIGYDDNTQLFDLYDSLYDPPTTMPYTELYELWRVFNWTYLVIAPPEHWDEVTALIGPDMDDTVMYEGALAHALAEAEAQPETCVAYADCADWVTFAWFTAGTNLVALDRPAEAAAAYDQARQLGLHYRMLWYQHGPYESYYAAGRYDDVIALADATLATANNLEESYLWRGKARLALGDAAGAEDDYRTALKYHEGWQPALDALAGLESGN